METRGPTSSDKPQDDQDGLLVAKPNCGVKVGPSPDERIQPLVVELRRRIEVFALRCVFDRLCEDDVGFLERTVERLGGACGQQDVGATVEHDMALHRFLVERTGDPDLLAIWLPIVSRMMLHYSRHWELMESHREHQAIVDSIRAKNIKTAVRSLQENIQ